MNDDLWGDEQFLGDEEMLPTTITESDAAPVEEYVFPDDGDCQVFFDDAEPIFDDRNTVVGVTVSSSQPRSPLKTRVPQTLRRVLAALDGASPDAARALIARITSSDRALSRMDETTRRIFTGVFEVIEHEASVLESGVLRLDDLPVLPEYDDDVQAEVARIRAVTDRPADPHATWSDLVESVQRQHSKAKALTFVQRIDDRAPVAEQMKAFREIEPSTTKKAVSRVRAARTAKEASEEYRQATAGRPKKRYSSGLPTLDRAYTPQGDPLGLVGPGEFIVVMGPTGTGKTSFSYAITPALVQDMVNQGEQDATQIVFHTEEETIDKIRGFRMDHGQRFAHLADNLIVDAVGTSRTRMAEVLYDTVIAADEWSRATGRPITDKLPRVVQLDYIQSIAESADEKTETATTAEFLLRGVCAWNPEEMAKFSGVDFREYAGMAWPSGMEMHRVGVIAYAQLVKIDDASLYYKKPQEIAGRDGAVTKKGGSTLSDFVLLDSKDEPSWDVKEGDLRLFGKNQMRGSGIIAQNANAILILHRSVPLNNPAKLGDDGKEHLTDTRARILFDKARAGTRLPYAPMRFDRQVDGPKAQYFDELAERALESGHLKDVDLSQYTPGDPILPLRPRQNPLAAYRY